MMNFKNGTEWFQLIFVYEFKTPVVRCQGSILIFIYSMSKSSIKETSDSSPVFKSDAISCSLSSILYLP